MAAVDHTPEAFVTRFVAPSRPAIITGTCVCPCRLQLAFTDLFTLGRCHRRLEPDYLEARYGRVETTVNLTPNGWGNFVMHVGGPTEWCAI